MSRSDKRKGFAKPPGSAAERPKAPRVRKRGAVVLLAAAAVVSVVLVREHVRGNYQERFLQALTSGRTAELMRLLHPGRRWDERALSAYMSRVRANLGGTRSICEPVFGTWTNCQWSRGTGQWVRVTKCVSVVQFEKGAAELELTLWDGLVVGWQLKSDQLPAD